MIAELGVFALGTDGLGKASPARSLFAMRVVRAVFGQPVLVLLARRLLGAVCGGQFA